MKFDAFSAEPSVGVAIDENEARRRRYAEATRPLDVSLDHAHCVGSMRIGPWIQHTLEVRGGNALIQATLKECRSAFNVDCTYWWNSVWRKSTRDPRINLLSEGFTVWRPA